MEEKFTTSRILHSTLAVLGFLSIWVVTYDVLSSNERKRHEYMELCLKEHKGLECLEKYKEFRK